VQKENEDHPAVMHPIMFYWLVTLDHITNRRQYLAHADADNDRVKNHQKVKGGCHLNSQLTALQLDVGVTPPKMRRHSTVVQNTMDPTPATPISDTPDASPTPSAANTYTASAGFSEKATSI